MRPGPGNDFRNDVAGFRIDNVPMRFLERWQIDDFAIRRNGHPITSALIRLFPEQLVRGQVKAQQRLQRAHVNALERLAGANAFDVHRLPFVEASRRNPPHEFVFVVNIEHEDAVPAVLQIVPNARFGHIQKARRRLRRNREQKNREESQEFHAPEHASVARCPQVRCPP